MLASPEAIFKNPGFQKDYPDKLFEFFNRIGTLQLYQSEILMPESCHSRPVSFDRIVPLPHQVIQRPVIACNRSNDFRYLNCRYHHSEKRHSS
ncbi:MAG: hypothetical protein ACLQHK_14305 [Gallionellaceae bacterium]